MKQHRKMFQYVEEMLYSYDRRKGDKSKNKIEYDRYAHTLRVYQWMLRITRELKDDSLDVESLKIATIFHDVGSVSLTHLDVYKRQTQNKLFSYHA